MTIQPVMGKVSKVAYKSADLFGQQRHAATHDVGLQLLLIRLKEAVEQLWDIDIPVYTRLKFVINFGHMDSDESITTRFPVRLSAPVEGVVEVTFEINPDTIETKWSFEGNGRRVEMAFTPEGEKGALFDLSQPQSVPAPMRVRHLDFS
jgi:hypothetical protein